MFQFTKTGRRPASRRARPAEVGLDLLEGRLLMAVSPVNYSVTNDAALWRYTDSGGWQALTGNNRVQSISLGTDKTGHDVVYAVTTDGAGWEWLDRTNTWVQMTGPGRVLTISGGTNGNSAIITTDHALYADQDGAITALTGPGRILTVSVGQAVDGEPIMWAVSNDHALWEYDGGWQSLTGADRVAQVVGASNGLTAFAVTTDGSLYRYDVALGWSALTGPARVNSIALGHDQFGLDTLYAVTTDGAVWDNAVGTNLGWTQEAAPGPAAAVTGSTLGQFYVEDADHSLWHDDGQGHYYALTAPGRVS